MIKLLTQFKNTANATPLARSEYGNTSAGTAQPTGPQLPP